MKAATAAPAADIQKGGAVGSWSQFFCTVEFTCAIVDKDVYNIFRQHGNLPYTELGKEIAVGKIETGKVFEQPIMVTDNRGKPHQFRRIRVLLEKATREFLQNNLALMVLRP